MKILANYNEIRATGQTMKNQAGEYEAQMNQMLARMNELQSIWQGSDSQAFLGQLEALRPKMLQLKAAIDSYSELLVHNANAYAELQANRTANAMRL